MRKSTAALALAAGVLAAAPAAADCERRPVVFANVAVATGDVVSTDFDVVAVGGRVLALGPAGTVTRPAGADVVDGAGHTLLPGLVDAHAHLFELGGPNDE